MKGKAMKIDFLGPDTALACNRPLEAPPLTHAELVQLQSRVIALENLVVALLAQGTLQQLELARNMATYISPRPGFTPHPLTTHAAARMVHFVERADHFRGMAP